MAYVIGSQKGKDIAKNMKAGQSWTNTTDGSTWTKKSDGSVSVTHNGVTYNNAYTPSSSGGSTGVMSYSQISGAPSGSSSNKSSGGSYGGGSSVSNSQYTKPNLGNTWDANTDYQAIINNAVKNGDYVTAAKAEQLRNQKIISTGSKYNTTNMYSGHLDNTDYGTMGQQLMANNGSWQDVLDIYNARYNKAATTEGLQQYANDEIQQMMWQYIVDNMRESNQPEEWNDEMYEQENPRPEDYNNPYKAQIDAILNEILTREDFSYDVMNDPLYQQYAKMYQREGDRAMKETMAEAAAGAGGMNTYAITAAQQANSYYGSQLNDKIPQLYQLAYDMYLNDKESKVQDLGILQNMDVTQYNRYRDTINDWYADKNFAYGVYQDAVNQGNWNTNFDYNAMVDNRNWNNDEYWKNKEWNYNDEWKNKEWDYNDAWRNKEWDYNDAWRNKEWDASQSEIEYNKNIYDQETAKEEVWKLINLGVKPNADLIARSGMSEADVNAAVESVKAEKAPTGYVTRIPSRTTITSSKNSNSASGGDGSSNTNNSGDVTETTNDTSSTQANNEDKVWTKGVSDLGLGSVLSPEVIVRLERAGAISEQNGKLVWNNGWHNGNYWERLLAAERANPLLNFGL